MFDNLLNGFYQNFIRDNRYELIFRGLGNTLLISLLAAFIGIVIGSLLTFCKLSKYKILRLIANVYIDIIRGTPAFTQLLVFYFVIFGSFSINRLIAAAIAFGVNSGAYVSEIIRAGILSIDKGQTEAGRSLGFSSGQTMRLIVFPQAIKNILPALTNEFIVLIKETSVAGYIGVVDIMKAANLIQTRTFSYTWTLMGSAVIYYIIIKILTIIFSNLENHMRKADAR